MSREIVIREAEIAVPIATEATMTAIARFWFTNDCLSRTRSMTR
jgi:hypothetical protein